MKRLTKRIKQYVYYTQGKYEDTLPVEMETNDIRSVLKKLAEYEDLEEQLEKVYGECDGLLETAINSLVRHEGAEIGTPAKARLLTDEDVDKWLAWKDAEEQGLLLRLPCKIGTKIYYIGSEINDEINELEYFVSEYGFKPYMLEELGKRYFLTKEEAVQELAKMEEGK